MRPADLLRQDARIEETAHAEWRDWRRYLQAQLTLLDVRIAEGQALFERADELEEEAERARRDLAILPAARRTFFAAVCATTRTAVQTELEAEQRSRPQAGRLPPLDPDVVDRTTWTRLLDQASGVNTSDGGGWFPKGTAEDIRWYSVDVAHCRTPRAKLPTMRAKIQRESASVACEHSAS